MFLINIDLLGTLIIKHYLYSDLTNKIPVFITIEQPKLIRNIRV